MISPAPVKRAAGAPAADKVVEVQASKIRSGSRRRWCCGERPGSPGFRTDRLETSHVFPPARLALLNHARAFLGRGGEDHFGAKGLHDLAPFN